MNNRAHIKRNHEKHITDQFIQFMTSHTGNMHKFIDQPEPPDAIIQVNGNIMWIEIVDIFRNPQEARSQYSYATPGEVEYSLDNELIIDPNGQIENTVFLNLQKKLMHQPYKEITEKYSKGTLILNERDPLFDDRLLNNIIELVNDLKSDGYLESNYFHSIYISYRSSEGLSYIKLADPTPLYPSA